MPEIRHVTGICQDLKTGERRQESLAYVYDPDHPRGAVKDVFFSPDGSYVIAFYREERNVANRKNRLEKLVFKYRTSIFAPKPQGEYWNDIFCWPTHIIEADGKIGIACPTYRSNFRFSFGGKTGFPAVGKEKTASWFCNPYERFGLLDKREIGDWRRCFDCALVLARGIRRLHTEGLVHSDLSHRNVLIDPSDRPDASKAAPTIAIIDLDGLVVPYDVCATPDVEGTAGCQAPELVQFPNAPVNTYAELHSLAVLIYQYLLCRHPLDGKMICDKDPKKDDELRFGQKALFIEDTTNPSNRYDWSFVEKTTRKKKTIPFLRPWCDLDALPYTVLGPKLAPLVEKAFVDGLHNPQQRPHAMTWENALFQTLDLLVPCSNPSCQMKWYIPGVNPGGKCPFCGEKEPRQSPFVSLYDKNRRGNGFNTRQSRRINLWHGVRFYLWHMRPETNRPQRESMSRDDLRSFGVFLREKSEWHFRALRQGISIVEKGTEHPLDPNCQTPIHNGTEFRLRERFGTNETVQAIVHLP